ncbi:MAG TPA: hypothetical protein PLO63_11580 [Syntrophales bacterium]|nr:hypothetical protein [Syntrophales bacterium]
MSVFEEAKGAALLTLKTARQTSAEIREAVKQSGLLESEFTALVEEFEGYLTDTENIAEDFIRNVDSVMADPGKLETRVNFVATSVVFFDRLLTVEQKCLDVQKKALEIKARTITGTRV